MFRKTFPIHHDIVKVAFVNVFGPLDCHSFYVLECWGENLARKVFYTLIMTSQLSAAINHHSLELNDALRILFIYIICFDLFCISSRKGF